MKERKLKARAKINLGLDVLRRRPDGYHDLRMVMQTVNLYDEITLRVMDAPAESPGNHLPETDGWEPDIRMTVLDGTVSSSADAVSGAVPAEETPHAPSSGEKRASEDPPVPGDLMVPADSRNLAYRAAQLLMGEFGIMRGLEIILKKRIPTAAGLAGGSSDAAAVLVGVNELFGLNLTTRELMERGVKIGADVPYCIMRGTALAEGIGERLTRLPNAPDAYVLLAKPPVQVSTKFVYSNLRLDGEAPAAPFAPHVGDREMPCRPDIDAQVQAIRDGDLYRMAELMGNVLETVTVPAFPVIGEIREQMMRCGAVNAMMSGSGPTVFGLFDDREKAKRAYASLAEGTLAKEVFLTVFFHPNEL